MALRMRMADGTEPLCPSCLKGFKPGDFKVERPARFDRHQRPDDNHAGAHHMAWVHEKCSPTKTRVHGRTRR